MAERGFTVRLTANIDSYVAAMNKAKASTTSMSSESAANLAKVGGQMQKLGGMMTRAVTLPIAGAGVAAIKMSSDFESAFGRMVGLAGVAADEVDGLKQSVLDLAGQTAKAPQELADALYEASSAGLDTAQALDAVKVAAKASAAGMGSAQDIVGLVASATAAYGAENINAARATDILTSAIREGRADPAELAGTLGRVLPIANQLGVSFEEVGGATAYLSNVFGDTNRTVTALQGFLVKLVSPSAQGRQALLDMGTSAEELKQSIDDKGLLGALELLKTHGFQDNAQAMAMLFDDIEGRQGALALMADESGNLANIMDKTAHSAGSLDEAFGAVTETSGFKMKKAWADVQVALIKAGDVMMPVIAGIAGAIGQLADIFTSLPGPVQAIIIGFLGVAAAAGPVLVIGGSLIRNFKEIRSAMSVMGGAAATASLALGAVGLVMIAATKIYSDNAAKKARLVKITNDFTDALKAERDGQKGVVDSQVTSLIANQDLLDKAHALGLATSDVAKIVKGEAVPAWDALRAGTNNATIGLNEAGEVTGSTTYTQRQHAAAVNDVTTALGPMVQGLQDAIDLQKLADKTVRDATVVYGAGTQSALEHGGALGRVADEMGNLPPVAHKVVLSEQEQTAAIKDATNALDRQVTALQDDLDAQQALIDFARGAADAQYALADSTDDYDRFLEELPDKLKEINKSKDSEAEKLRQVNALYRSGSELAAGLADDVVTAYDEASDGALTAKEKGDLWRDSMLKSALAASGPVRQSILDYAFAVNEVPDEKKTAIIAAVEAGDLATAIALLDGASETRKVEVQADVDDKKLGETKGKLKKLEDPLTATLMITADASGVRVTLDRVLGGFRRSADGRYVDHPMVSTLGEGGLPEVVLPLTRPGRMAELMRDRRVSGPILGALGGTVASADGRVVNLTHTTIPGPVASSSSVSGPSADDVNAAQDKLMERQFKRDAISYDEYRAYLAKRKEGLALYSDDEQELFDRIQQLDENQAKAREHDAQIQIDMTDRIKQYQFDTNQISLADYMDYLTDRRTAYGVYTAEWFEVTNEMADVQGKLDQAALDATKSVFDQADAVKALADANQANLDADAEYAAAGAKLAAAKTPQDKQAAADEYNRAATNHASTAYNFTEAQAASQGLRPGTPEWAKFMRARLTEDSVYSRGIGRANLADAIDRLLVGIPSFAAGGYVPATPGGRLIRVAEAGQGEYMTPANRMHAVMGGGSSVVQQYHITVEAPPTYDSARGVRDLVDGINKQLVASGHSPIGGRVRL